MQVSRVVKVAVNDKSIQWNNFSKLIFSDFVFEIPNNFRGYSFNEPGAKVRLEFIKDDSQLDVYIENGSDPFLRPFLFLYWLQVPANEELPKPVIENILKWVARVSMINMNFCVIIVQEEVSFFGSPKMIDRASLLPDSKLDNNLIIIPAKRQMKLSDFHLELVKSKVRNLLIDSFEIYEMEARNLIRNSESSSSHYHRRKVWRSFLLYYYGFMGHALSGFLESYGVLIRKLEDPLAEAIPPIDPNWITTYPLTRDNNYSTVLMFALGGAMAIYYSKVEFLEIYNLFMRQWAHMISSCSNKEQESFVDSWAMQSLEAILSISDIAANMSINIMLLMQKYLLSIKINSSLVPELFQQLIKLTENQKNTSAVITSNFLEWSAKNKAGLPQICQETLMWDFGVNDAFLHYERACHAEDHEGIVASAKVLLNSQATNQSKSDIIMRMSGFNRVIQIEDPIHAKFELSSTECQMYTVFTLNITAYMPYWMTTCPDLIEITYVTDENSLSTKIAKPSSMDSIIDRVTFKNSGEWKIEKICYKYGNLVFIWKHLDYLRPIHVSEPEMPNINLDFPSLTGIRMTMFLSLNFDFSNFIDVDIDTNVSVEDDRVSLINSKYESSFYNNGYIQFDVSPCGQVVSSKIDFQLKEIIESTDLVVKLRIGGIKYEKRFELSFKFPIEIECRVMTEDYAHVKLTNTSDSHLLIERAELGSSNWNSIKIDPNEVTYLLAEKKGVSTPTLTIFVKDHRGFSIAQSWEVMANSLPRVEAKFTGSPSYGKEIQIAVELPKGNVEIIGNSNIFVTGKTVWPAFEGGSFVFGIVPIIFGDVKMPDIKIDNTNYKMDTQTLFVPKPVTSVCVPFATSDRS